MNNTRPFDRREAFEIFLTFDGAGFSTEHAIERSIEAAQQFNAAVEATGGLERVAFPAVKPIATYCRFYAKGQELRIELPDGGTGLVSVFEFPRQATGMAIALNSIGAVNEH